MFLSRNKKNNVYPCKPQFYYIKVGFKQVKIIYACFRDVFMRTTKSDQTACVNRLISVFVECTSGSIFSHVVAQVSMPNFYIFSQEIQPRGILLATKHPILLL